MQEERLNRVRALASIDALTGVKNKHAYLEVEALMDRQIAEQGMAPFAIVMLDVNDLKKVNDASGHQAGDELLKDACKVICETFKHSPVFRVGGDEFVAIAQGADYERLEERLKDMQDYNAEALKSGGAVIACGTARFQDDTCVASVFERADRDMYEDKIRLKSRRRRLVTGLLKRIEGNGAGANNNGRG
jgi:diguanylate cyclase (GGDEF)-like protein